MSSTIIENKSSSSDSNNENKKDDDKLLNHNNNGTILHSLELTLGKDIVHEIIYNCKMIIVGAGGIGCEILKNLAMIGFKQLTVIDLDTIDVSNLNRQLLFRSNHVGQPKCIVATQVATELASRTTYRNNNPNVTINYQAYHGNICDNSLFNVSFFQKNADIVMNALDNVVARRRVNRLCLAAGLPLVEAGTTGYLGQVRTIHKDSGIACYECKTQETAKVYPICTIRSTPSAPVHTIVWSKELYKLLFHPNINDSMLYEDTSGDEPSTYMANVMKYRRLIQFDSDTSHNKTGNENGSDKSLIEIAKGIFINLYIDEVQKQLDMDRYKTSMKKPSPLHISILDGAFDGTKSLLRMPPSNQDSYKQTDIWNQTDCVLEFISCLQEASLSVSGSLLPTFDKDALLGMKFVTAASNLRNYVFQIDPIQSFYSAKGIAGNIIPAIASTNAIAAGLQVLQVFQILKAKVELDQKKKRNEVEQDAKLDLKGYCSYIDIVRHKTRNGLLISSAKLEEPNPNCFVCKNAIIPLSICITKWKLLDFIQKILKDDLGFHEPTISLDGDIIWEEGDDADTDSFTMNLEKHLTQLPCGGIQNGTTISIEDFSQDLSIIMAINHIEKWDVEKDGMNGENIEPDDHKFVIGGQKPTVVVPTDTKPSDAVASAASTEQQNQDDDDDDEIEIVDSNDGKTEQNDHKRHIEDVDHDDDELKPHAKKRAKIHDDSAMSEVEVIEID